MGTIMEITLNGKPHRLLDTKLVCELLAQMGFTGRPVLVEINQRALLASEQATTLLKNGDTVEIIQIVAGG